MSSPSAIIRGFHVPSKTDFDSFWTRDLASEMSICVSHETRLLLLALTVAQLYSSILGNFPYQSSCPTVETGLNELKKERRLRNEELITWATLIARLGTELL
jgi:hypothetical protein